MTKAIEEYLKNEGTSLRVASRIMAKLDKNGDIADELSIAIETGIIPTKNALSVEGYTAAMIHDIAPFMNLTAIYSFLIDLRDKPAESKEIITNGFPRK